MKKPFQVQCRDSKYDEEAEMLTLLLFFEEFGECRLVCLSKSDFCYKYPSNPVPHIEMHRTSELFKGKRFKIVIEDDPNRSRDAELKPEDMKRDFGQIIENELKEVREGLSDSQKTMTRRLGDVIEKDMNKRKSAGDQLADEMLIRAKLKDIKWK